MGAPIRSSIEITVVINRGLNSLAGVGLDVVNGYKRGLDITNEDQRDNIYRLNLLYVYLQNILDPCGEVLPYFEAPENELQFNQILDAIVSLSQGFDAAAIPLIGSINLPLIFFSTTSGGGGGGGTVPGFSTFDTSADTGGTTIDSFNANSGSSAFYVVSVIGPSGTRVSYMSVTWRGSAVPKWTEIKSEDVTAATSDLSLSFDLSGGLIRLRAAATSNGWEIRGFRILSP